MMDSNGNELILDGALNHVMESRVALRWVVLEKNVELGHVYLSIYRQSPAPKSDLKKRYELTESNFIGIESGTIETQHAKRSILYWTIILKQESILFNDKEALDKSASQFEKWNEVVKKYWNHQSWEVSPVQGSAIEGHPKLVLHLNTSSLCLALLSPPRHLYRWPLTNISRCDCHDCVFSFKIIGNDAPGDYEVKVTRSEHASKIKLVCNELTRVNKVKNMSSAYTPERTRISHYQNPIPKPDEKDNVGPPRHPRKRELHELIEQAREGKSLIMDFISSSHAWRQFCLHFSIKKDSYPVNDWRALAEKLGLKMTDIVLVEHTSRQPGICTSTEIVLAYWQSNAPDDMPFTQDQLVYELKMMDRLDMVTIFQQGEEQM